MEATMKLTRDIRNAAKNLSKEEAKYLVNMYYQMQEYRKATESQCRSMNSESDGENTHETLSFFSENFSIMEKNIKSALKKYAESQEIGKWMLSICGIGEVIAAGLLAHIDIKKVQTAGQIQAYAGLDPTREKKKGEKVYYNPKMKVLCWKIGESFCKVSNNPNDVYGHIYKLRKEYEQKKNENGDYADQAKAKLEKCNIGKTTEAYKWYSNGKLPPAHIDQRAKRYAVKIFLSHLFEVWYELDRGEKPPKPYALAILNHAHKIEIPNYDLVFPDKT